MMLNDPHPRIVISEDCEKSLSFAAQGLTLSPHVPRTFPLCSSVFHAARTLSAPTGHLPYWGRLFLYFAALRSFDSVLIFSDKLFFNTRRFSPLRMMKFAAPPPLNPLNPLNLLPLCHSQSRDGTPRGLTCHQETFGHRPVSSS